jgi:hypothetical protein
MTVLSIPDMDAKPWPTLGPQVWDWMLDNLVYGPGDLRGVPLADHPPDDEFRGLLYRAYEIYPRDHPRAGRRRFRRVGWSLRKGTAKTERAAWIAAAELHPDAPVRCDGWKRTGSRWDPVGVGVRDPYIPLVAYTEEQTEDLAYAALYTILSEGPLADDFDIGLERIMRPGGDGKAQPLASAPDARDGARTTFQHFDESHRLVLPRLVEASGPAAEWSDIDGIVGLWRDPTTDRAYFERVWLNRLVQQSAQGFDAQLFASLAVEATIDRDRAVVAGFDGSRFHDDTGLVVTDLETGLQIVWGHWRHPGRNIDGWEVPEAQVHEAVAAMFDRFDVKRFYCDPFYWESAVAGWSAEHGVRCVTPYATNRTKQIAEAIQAYITAMRAGELSHDDNPALTAHIGNARRRETHYRTGEGERLFTISKERPDSPHKIDLAMAAVLSWAARVEELDTPAEPVYRHFSW